MRCAEQISSLLVYLTSTEGEGVAAIPPSPPNCYNTNMKTILVDAIGALVLKEEGLYKPMVDMLDTYPNKKIILTNANNKEIQKFGLTYLPYELFTLQHDPEKTDPEYFIQMLDHFNLSASDVVYFEHNDKAKQSAESVGIKTYFYDENQKDIEGLRNFLSDNL